MNKVRLVDALQKPQTYRKGLSSVWIVVLSLVMVQVLNDCFGWLEDSTTRVLVGFVGGVLVTILVRMFRGY